MHDELTRRIHRFKTDDGSRSDRQRDTFRDNKGVGNIDASVPYLILCQFTGFLYDF